MLTTTIARDPFADGTLVLDGTELGALTIRSTTGALNNLDDIHPNFGAAGQPFIRLTPQEFEDGIHDLAGVANETGVRQPIGIFNTDEVASLQAQGLTVVTQAEAVGLGLNLDLVTPTAPFVLVNPEDRPNARAISVAVFDQNGVANPSPRSLSNAAWGFGQFVNHTTDLVEEGTSAEDFIPVVVGAGDPDFAPGAIIPLLRDEPEPGTGTDDTGISAIFVNIITSWLDLSSVYGSDPDITEFLRTGVGGELQVMDTPTGPLLPANQFLDTIGRNIGLNGDTDFGTGVPGFAAGDARAIENDGLASWHTAFHLHHNALARDIAAANPGFTDEQAFQRARQLNIAIFQKITLYDWLPSILGNGSVAAYPGYDPSANPNVTDEFAAAALRIGHTLVSPELPIRDSSGNTLQTIDFGTTFGAPNILQGSDARNLIQGLLSEEAQQVDNDVIDQLRTLLPLGGEIGGGLAANGVDLVSVNIQRGRDRGLSDYNNVRRFLNDILAEEPLIQSLPQALGLAPEAFNDVTPLPPAPSIEGLTANAADQQLLLDLYGTVEDIDLWVGLMSETPLPGSSVGATLGSLLKYQYETIRNADRFWYENPIGGQNGGFFTAEEIAEINNETLETVLTRTFTDSVNNPTGEGFVISSEAFFIDFNGTDASETLTGGVAEDVILALGGDDVVHGNAGNDFLNGNQGDDTVYGGLGDDTVRGGVGNDSVIGGDGNDVVWGDIGDDTLTGGTGADIFNYGSAIPFSAVGNDVIADFNQAEGDGFIFSDETFIGLAGGDTPRPIGSQFDVVSVTADVEFSSAVIVYNSTNGQLIYNVNGNAPGVAGANNGIIATLTGAPTIDAATVNITVV